MGAHLMPLPSPLIIKTVTEILMNFQVHTGDFQGDLLTWMTCKEDSCDWEHEPLLDPGTAWNSIILSDLFEAAMKHRREHQ